VVAFAWVADVTVAIAATGAGEANAKTRKATQEMTAQAIQGTPMTVGYVENVLVDPGKMRIKAKIDTGARSSSLDAANILPVTKDGKDWVRFTVVGEDERRYGFELPVVRTVRVKRAGAPPSRRYVVEMGICLGGIHKKAEVNLVSRRDMNYRMLIGRLYLSGDFVVDPQATFLTRPECQAR